MPAFRGTIDTLLGDSSSRNHRDRTRRHRSTPQYLQRVLYPRKPITRPRRGDANEDGAQPRRRTLSLWEVHATTIQRRENKFRQEERRRIASSLPVAIVNPLYLQTARPADRATIRSEAPQRPVNQVYEETPTEPDEDTRTEVATEIDEQTERNSVVSEEEGNNDGVRITTTCMEKKDSETPVRRNLENERKSEKDKQQVEHLPQDVIGHCVGALVLKMEEGQTKAQESDINPPKPPSQHQPNTTPEFIQGSSRDGQFGSGIRVQVQTEKVRGWLNSQSAFQTEGLSNTIPVHYNPHGTTLSGLSNLPLYPTPEPQPPAYYAPAPMDIIPDLNDYLMDTSPDPEEVGVFTASSLIPPQPMRDIQPTSARVANVSALSVISTYNTPSTTPSRSFDGYCAPSTPFASNPQPQCHSNATHLSTSSNPLPIFNALPLPRRCDDVSTLLSPSDRPQYRASSQNWNWSHLDPFLNVSQLRSQPDQPTHRFPPPDWCTTCGQTLFRQPIPLSESVMFAAPIHRVEAVGTDTMEEGEERDVEPFIIEACEEQEGWWDATAGSPWTKATHSHQRDSNSQNGASVLDVTRPALTRIVWRDCSTRRPSSSVDDTGDAARSLERFDERLGQHVDTEELRRFYSSHTKVLVSEDRRTKAHRQKQRTRSSHRSPKQIYKSPCSSQKRLYQKSFRTPIHRVLDDLTAIISRIPSVFL